METKLVDTCIFIDYLRGKTEVYEMLVHYRQLHLAMSPITMMELVIGAFNKAEVLHILKAFKNIPIIHIDRDTSVLALGLITQYSKSHNLCINDAIIAATAIQNGMELIRVIMPGLLNLGGTRRFLSPAKTIGDIPALKQFLRRSSSPHR